jgi:hypothetical protein
VEFFVESLRAPPPFHSFSSQPIGTTTALALLSDMARSVCPLSPAPKRRIESHYHMRPSVSSSSSHSSTRRSPAFENVPRFFLLLLLLVLTIGTRAAPDFTSSLTCADESLFIGTTTVCTWTPQDGALPTQTTASFVRISSHRHAPFVNKSIPIGTMTALFPASSASSSFTFNVTAGLKTGTYLIKVVDTSPDESPLGQFYIVVSSTQYIVLSDYVEDMSKSWQIDLPARFAGMCLRLLLFRPIPSFTLLDSCSRVFFIL